MTSASETRELQFEVLDARIKSAAQDGAGALTLKVWCSDGVLYAEMKPIGHKIPSVGMIQQRYEKLGYNVNFELYDGGDDGDGELTISWAEQ